MRYLLFFLLLICAVPTQAQNEEGEDKGYILHSIYFGGGSNYVDEYQQSVLYHLLDSIPNVETYTITIHSHTDNIGGKEYNEWLSQKRSQTVIQKLIDKGIFPEMILQKDFGQLNPVFDNSTYLGRLKNRRVDVILWPSSL
ncbi:MAG: OmpA family protein [Bacteroidota bacterium]